MIPSEKRKEIALAWLKRAQGNLIRAKMEKPEKAFYEDFCFDAQQAAEKSLKALMIFNEIKFRFVHDIGEFLQNLKEAGLPVPTELKEAVILTEYAVETRYPGPIEPVTFEDYNKAVDLSEKVYNWVEEQITRQLNLF